MMTKREFLDMIHGWPDDRPMLFAGQTGVTAHVVGLQHTADVLSVKLGWTNPEGGPPGPGNPPQPVDIRVVRESTGPKGPVMVVEPMERGDVLEDVVACAHRQVNSWCLLNNIALPTVEVLDHRPEGARQHEGLYKWSSKTVQIYSVGCPVNSDQSWPRWLRDYSPLGVLAHEYGHHVHQELKRKRVDRLFYDCRCSVEQPVSVYARTENDEDFAEAIRLFITNPYLLQEKCPRRYEFLTDTLKLVQIDWRDWKTCLDNPTLEEKVRRREWPV